MDCFLRCIFEVDLGIFSHLDNINLPVFTMDDERIKQFFNNGEVEEEPTSPFREETLKQIYPKPEIEEKNNYLENESSVLHDQDHDAENYYNQHKIFDGRKSSTRKLDTEPVHYMLSTTPAPATQSTVVLEQDRFTKDIYTERSATSYPVSITSHEYSYITEPTPMTERTDLRKFFGNLRRKNIFEAIREKGREKSVTARTPSSDEDQFKAQFAHFERKPSIEKDKDGNLVISGGSKVFHLPPGISPPGSNQVTSPQQHSVSGTHALRPEEPLVQEDEPIFFDPLDAPHAVDALKNSKNAVIQVLTDDNQQMVLNVKNDQLLSILQALHSALDNVQP